MVGQVATRKMLTQNSEMKKNNIFNWTLPAWVVKDSKGVAINVCNQAGGCIKFCYARNGTYNFPAVKAAHLRNLEFTRDDLSQFLTDMINELSHKRFAPTGLPRLPEMDRGYLSAGITKLLDQGSACIRIHDSGDIYSEEYLLAWLTVSHYNPNILFYCYTKEVELIKRVVGESAPANFLWCFSMGGRQDYLIDQEKDYHADVFPNSDALELAGYYSQDSNDLLCVVAPSNRIGIPANNIPHFNKKMAGRTFSQIEIDLKRHKNTGE
jgi:hypothetical protein